MKKADVIALIPARGGSKGVPKKNIKLLGGYPLIAYSIAAAKLSEMIERVVISTDSEEIANVARQFGAEVPFLRPAEFAGDRSPDIEFVVHAMDWFQQNEAQVPEYIVHVRTTTPLREPGIVDDAIRQILINKEATSLRSAHPAPESPFKWFLKSKDGWFKGITPNVSNEAINNPRQGFPNVYVPDGYVDVLKTSFIATHAGILHGDKILVFISPVCREVDTPEDFEYLGFELKTKGSPLLKYLNENFPKERLDVERYV